MPSLQFDYAPCAFVWLEQITQDILDSMVTSVPVRYAIVEAGRLLFIPMGTMVIEKSMGNNASAVELVVFASSPDLQWFHGCQIFCDKS